jgi:AhpD family alkylhydroperoxidase
MTTRDYVAYRKDLNALAKRLRAEVPGPMSGFGKLHAEATRDDALSRKTKELIAIALAICSHCDGCIAFHVHDALEAGAIREEISEAVGAAILMGGGPAMVYGSEALDALRQFEEASFAG